MTRLLATLGGALLLGLGCGGRTAPEAGFGEGGHAAAVGTAGGGATSGAAAGDPIPAGDDLVDVTGMALNLPASCGGMTASYDWVPLSLEVVVDLSATMSERDDWAVVRDELRSALGALSVPAEVAVAFFPNMPTPPSPHEPGAPCIDSTDDVPRAWFDDAQRRAVDAALLAASPLGAAGAPIHDAYLEALERLQPASIGTRVVLLVTNGYPTYGAGCAGTG